jgi:hypothetical protein
VRIFVNEGVPMRDLLRHAVTKGIGGAHARRAHRGGPVGFPRCFALGRVSATTTLRTTLSCLRVRTAAGASFL